MPRYGRDYGAHAGPYREGGPGRRNRYAPRYDRGGYGRDYDGGWGMTGLYNTIMHRGPRGRERYGERSFHRPSGAPYGFEFERSRYGTDYRSGRSPDAGSIGVHYRGPGRGYDRGAY